MRFALFVVELFNVAMIGGNGDQVTMLFCIVCSLIDITAHCGCSLQLRLGVRRMTDHVAVGEVGQNKIIAFIDRTQNLFRDLGQAEFRLLIKRDSLRRGYAHVGLARKRLVIATVKEKCHMRVLFRLRTVELTKAGF